MSGDVLFDSAEVFCVGRLGLEKFEFPSKPEKECHIALVLEICGLPFV